MSADEMRQKPWHVLLLMSCSPTSPRHQKLVLDVAQTTQMLSRCVCNMHCAAAGVSTLQPLMPHADSTCNGSVACLVQLEGTFTKNFHETLKPDLRPLLLWPVLISGHIGFFARGGVFLSIAILFFR